MESCLDEYDRFYAEIEALLRWLLCRHQRLLLLDLHSYNYRRAGVDAAAAASDENPQINVGTGTMMRRERWASLIDRFLVSLRGTSVAGRTLDVRETVKFFGGYFPEWVHVRYPKSVCVLSIECKKFFMDEWRGVGDIETLEALRVAFARSADAARAAL